MPTVSFNSKPVINEVNNRLQSWAKAWSSQRPEAYLAFYASSYKPANGLSNSRWQAQRKVRLKKPSFIKVQLASTSTRLINKTSAETLFIQSYHADHYRDRVQKRILWVKQQGKWKIKQETTLKKLKS